MLKRWLVFILVLALAWVLPAAAQDDDRPALKALDYLKSIQNEDGGFSNGFAPESDPATTADVVFAAANAGQDTSEWVSAGGITPLEYLEGEVSDGVTTDSAGIAAKVLMALAAAGIEPGEFGGGVLVDDLLALQGDTGVFGAGMFDHCLALLALQNTGTGLPEGALSAVVDAQTEEGGWGFMDSTPADTNTTGLCLQALALSEEDETIQAGLDYLAAIQNEDGGWPYQNPSDYGTDSDTNSTALVLQALIATGQDLEEWNNPQEWLASMQLESGAFSFQAAFPGDNILATVAAIPALEGVPLILLPETAD